MSASAWNVLKDAACTNWRPPKSYSLQTIVASVFEHSHRFHLVHRRKDVFCSWTFEHTKRSCLCRLPLETPKKRVASEVRNVSCVYTSDVQRDRHNVCRSLKTRQYRVVFFCRAGVKINGAYYREVLLTQKLLPIIRQISGNEFVFQEDIASASRARETIELLRRETPDFISPSAARRGNKAPFIFTPALQKKTTLYSRVLKLRRTSWRSRWTSDV